MTSEGAMFKVTAQNCKEWANKAQNNAYTNLLVEIAEQARAGKYMLKVYNLSEDFESKLKAAGFVTIRPIGPLVNKKDCIIYWI